MKLSLVLFVTLFSAPSFANKVILSFTSHYQKGSEVKKINKTEAIALLGKEFTMPAEHGNPFKFKMTATENKEGFVVVESKIFDSSNNELSSSNVITAYGTEASITKNSGKESFSLKVVPERLKK